jgi:hypothetical protein
MDLPASALAIALQQLVELGRRLLGGAVRPCHNPAELAAGLELLLADGDWRRQLGQIGQRRMGPAGGSERLAHLLQRHLLG